ncbi:MAG TPA: hypothetical protein VLT32_06400 [Candidatus Sulfomarinibacteraceae bacterium]|nr:hypothetical protein [Candidatus Sulfomarinibacteraceae bacterium]
MGRTATTFLLAVAIALGLGTACRSDETPEQKLSRRRYNHEIYPVGATTLHDEEGNPTLLVDLNVANQGTEPLSALTVLVRVTGPDGAERFAERVTVPLEDLRPGIGRQIAVRLPGYELKDDDELTVELETKLPAEVLRSLPEWADVAG